MSNQVLPPALARQAEAGELSQAYLLTGADDSRLEELARALAAACLCTGEAGARPCGQCRHCRKVDRDIHPDVSWIQRLPDKSDLSVDQIRALRADAYIRPNEAARKIYIVKRAYQMNEAAQNAFLKVMEDGPAYALFLLLAPNAMTLLPTVRSRCQTVLAGGEARSDPELERRGGELAGLLLEGDRWRLVSWCVPYEKAKREEVLPLWEAARRALLIYRRADTTPQAAALAAVLGEIIAAGGQNGNMGILWGRLWAAV